MNHKKTSIKMVGTILAALVSLSLNSGHASDSAANQPSDSSTISANQPSSTDNGNNQENQGGVVGGAKGVWNSIVQFFTGTPKQGNNQDQTAGSAAQNTENDQSANEGNAATATPSGSTSDTSTTNANPTNTTSDTGNAGSTTSTSTDPLNSPTISSAPVPNSVTPPPPSNPNPPTPATVAPESQGLGGSGSTPTTPLATNDNDKLAVAHNNVVPNNNGGVDDSDATTSQLPADQDQMTANDRALATDQSLPDDQIVDNDSTALAANQAGWGDDQELATREASTQYNDSLNLAVLMQGPVDTD